MISAAIAGLLLGLAGSFHCIGMCGPLILAIPFQGIESKTKKTIAYVLYGAGKTLAYGSLGLLVGLIGGQARQLSAQRYVSIVAGVLLLISAVAPMVFKISSFQPTILKKPTAWVNQHIAKQFKNERIYSFGVIGFLNGLLPCGLVYVAIAAAISTSCVSEAVLFMLFFGIATMLSLTVFSILFQKLSSSIRNKIRRFFPYLIIITALLLILRGLELGIPYISPIFDAGSSKCGHSCCGS